MNKQIKITRKQLEQLEQGTGVHIMLTRAVTGACLLLLGYSAYSHEWQFAAQYALILVVTFGWTAFDVLVLEPYEKKVVIALKRKLLLKQRPPLVKQLPTEK